MRMARLLTIGFSGLAGLLLLTGCGPSPEQLQIEAQAERINGLTTENDDLRSRLALAISERDAARARAYALEQQIFELRKELAEKPPVEEGPWEQAGPFSWIDIGTDFLFDSGKATLKPAGRTRLQEVLNQINDHYGDKMIWVIGHTDAEPIKATKHLYKDNLDLSLTRGATVYRELMRLGLTPQRMVAGGQGEYQPKAPNDAKGKSKINRRVQLIAVPMPPTSGTTPAGEAGATPPGKAGDLVIK